MIFQTSSPSPSQIIDNSLANGAVGVREDAFSPDEDLVELMRPIRAGRGHAADDPVVFNELRDHPPGKNAFRAVGDADVGSFSRLMRKTQIRSQVAEPAGELLPVPTGAVDSRITRLPASSTGAMERAADSM